MEKAPSRPRIVVLAGIGALVGMALCGRARRCGRRRGRGRRGIGGGRRAVAVQDAQVVPGAARRIAGVKFVAGTVDDLERGLQLGLVDVEGGHGGGELGGARLLLGDVGLLERFVELLAVLQKDLYVGADLGQRGRVVGDEADGLARAIEQRRNALNVAHAGQPVGQLRAGVAGANRAIDCFLKPHFQVARTVVLRAGGLLGFGGYHSLVLSGLVDGIAQARVLSGVFASRSRKPCPNGSSARSRKLDLPEALGPRRYETSRSGTSSSLKLRQFLSRILEISTTALLGCFSSRSNRLWPCRESTP